MFTWVNKLGVQSDLGYSVQFTGRFTLEYREGNLIIVCACEGGSPMVEVDVPSAQERPFSHGGVRLERRDQIIRNIGEALRFMGLVPVIR